MLLLMCFGGPYFKKGSDYTLNPNPTNNAKLNPPP